MDKINFEDGQLISEGYVIINEKKYFIVPAVYEGDTPLSSFILNKMQNNIENAIEEKATKDTATNNDDGLMSKDDKNKLDKIEKEANKYILPLASDTLGGVKTTSKINSNVGYIACPIIDGIPYYKDADNDVKFFKYRLDITQDTELGAEIELPFYYKVGANVLDVYYVGQRLIKCSTNNDATTGHYSEVGDADSISNQIKITSDWKASTGNYFEFVVRGEYSI